ncbi:MAG: response regulator [Desulfosarcinaceae bacterium]|nr:response regulator [Desulfosarcinaceae bacterium]
MARPDIQTPDLLLVDDEAGIRTVLGIALEEMGYAVRRAADAESALRLMADDAPQILLTDIKMPGMDGIALLKEVKAHWPDTEVIMLTGHGDIDLAIRSLKYDATDFITKPIHDEVLEVALKRARERIEMRAQLNAHTENLERLVAEKSRQLVEAERFAAIGETVAGLAHGIKNIAGGLKGGAFVLEKGLELDNRDYLLKGWEMIRGNVKKIKNLSLDLLDFSTPADPQVRVCDPNRLAEEAVALMMPRADALHIPLTCEATQAGGRISCDPDGIQRCLLNLIANALDAGSDPKNLCDAPSVVVRVAAVEPDQVVFTVEDTCGGMPEDVKAQALRRFFTTKGSRGTGIGLMLSQKIVAQHGGTLQIASQWGQGTRVEIVLPSGPPI